jgi:hypothetical protein
MITRSSHLAEQVRGVEHAVFRGEDQGRTAARRLPPKGPDHTILYCAPLVSVWHCTAPFGS